MQTNRLKEIQELGQAIWLDDLTRELVDDGELARMVAEDGLTGVTSNPTIFKQAIVGSERYDEDLSRALETHGDARAAFFDVAIADVRGACELLHPVFDRTGGADGYVSFELPPELAYDAEGSVSTAIELRDRIDQPNVLIKVPGTAEGVHAFEELTAAGISINVTLLFDVSRYEEIAQAYLNALERRAEAGQSLDTIASVASFFVSRVDTKVDSALFELGRGDLAGRAAIANARVAYRSFRRIFSGQRWQALAARGALVQRPLWASTSTKNPNYPDTFYVSELIGPETVNTMPRSTFEVARDHAPVRRTIDRDVNAALGLIDEVRSSGVPFDDIVSRELVVEGVDAFADSFDSLIEAIAARAVEIDASARG